MAAVSNGVRAVEDSVKAVDVGTIWVFHRENRQGVGRAVGDDVLHISVSGHIPVIGAVERGVVAQSNPLVDLGVNF